MDDQQELEKTELDNPLPPNTMCLALYDFVGSGPKDLGFKAGENLVIVEPSKEMFWYVARNSTGRTGLVPITFLEKANDEFDVLPPAPPLPTKPRHLSRRTSQDTPPPTPSRNRSVSPFSPPVPSSPRPPRPVPDYLQLKDDSAVPPPLPPARPPKSATLPRLTTRVLSPPLNEKTQSLTPEVARSIDERPPMPLPSVTPTHKSPSSCRIQVGHYSTIQAFRDQSGWFKPTPDYVLCKKMTISLQAFRGMTVGVYYFQHKFKDKKQYIGQSLNLHSDLVSLFSRLYEKKEDHLNNLEKELRYNSPDADNWNVSVWTCHHENLAFLHTKLVVQQRTLPPNGLNECIEFNSRKHFHLFCEWYTEYRLKNQHGTDL